ncbi:MoaD/ThiS family protein [Alteromonas sp.]|jgi:molybdopterin synthase sulfur carrier subunit|nr:MoaD/ThiS family protein [Alteromonas sp.]
MQITIKTFAQTREVSGCSSLALDVDNKSTVADVIMHLKQRSQNWANALESNVLTARNQTLCSLDTVVSENDEIAFFPPVTGG